MINPYEASEAFIRDFRAAEFSLKRSGFKRPNRDIAEADWDRFAQHLGPAFFSQVVQTGIAKTLVGLPPRRLMANMMWTPENPDPLVNVAQLIVNGVCRVRNSYIHGEKFTGGPEGQWERDLTLIREAHAVLAAAMLYCDVAA